MANSGFPFKVPAQIPSGTRVVLDSGEGGTVLKFDDESFEYLVQLDNNERKLLPDFLVASLNGPKSLAEVRRSSWKEGSSLAAIDVARKTTLPVFEEVKKLAHFDSLDFHSPFGAANKVKHPPGLVEEAAEREALVSLMVSLKALLRRQDELLNASERLDEILAGLSDAATLVSHRAWLEEGIQLTGLSLSKVLKYLQLFYGSVYLPPE